MLKIGVSPYCQEPCTPDILKVERAVVKVFQSSIDQDSEGER